MKRDWDVVRQILIAAEAIGPKDMAIDKLDGVDNDVFHYHARILADGRLIQRYDAPIHSDRGIEMSSRVPGLTWAGHELLDKLRDEKLWGRIKKAAEEKSLSMSFEVVGIIFKQIAKNKLGVDLD